MVLFVFELFGIINNLIEDDEEGTGNIAIDTDIEKMVVDEAVEPIDEVYTVLVEGVVGEALWLK